MKDEMAGPAEHSFQPLPKPQPHARVNVHELFTLEDTAGLLEYYLRNEKARPTMRNRLINYLLDRRDNGDVDALEHVRSILKLDGIVMTDQLDLGVLLIRYHLAGKNYDAAVAQYHALGDNVRKRHLSLLIEYLLYVGRPTDAVVLYDRLAQLYEVEAPDVEMFFFTGDPKVLSHVLDVVEKKPLEFSEPVGYVMTYDPAGPFAAGDYRLQKYKFTDDERSSLLVALESQMKIDASLLELADRAIHASEPLTNSQYPWFIIDGANVLHHGDLRVLVHSYRRLLMVTEQCAAQGNVIIVLNGRHLQLKQWGRHADEVADLLAQIGELATIYSSPRGFNDDYYHIWLAIRIPDAVLVTNDKFRDHIYALSPLLRMWRQEYVVEYDIPKPDAKAGASAARQPLPTLYPPLSYSRRVQSDDQNHYLPYVDGMWLMVPRYKG